MARDAGAAVLVNALGGHSIAVEVRIKNVVMSALPLLLI